MRTRSASKAKASAVPEPEHPVVPDMFSPATFFDVLEAIPSEVSAQTSSTAEPTELLKTPAVVAFYGFRGGAGRTLALAHVAALLTSRGVRVVVVDLDIEAPGAEAVFGIPKLESGQGAVALLRQALIQPEDEPLPIWASLRSCEVSGRKLHILPAGRIDETYLAQIEELGIGLWHQKPTSPLSRLVRELAEAVPYDVVLLDCRTGFSGLSASALFHTSHLVVTFLPMSNQIWDGLDVLLKAARTARRRRQRPALLLCPTMVPPGETGRRMLAEFVPKLREKYAAVLEPVPPDEASEDPEQPTEPILEDGIRYDAAIAEAGRLDPVLQATSWKNYERLTEEMAGLIDLAPSPVLAVSTVDSKKILEEIAVNGSWAFAEQLDTETLAKQFVAPSNLAAAIDRSTTLILGAKGAGKTWLWRYLVAGGKGGSSVLPKDVIFVSGHGPDPKEGGPLQLSADALKEIERSTDMNKKGTYQAFWRLYVLARLASHYPALKDAVSAQISETKRRKQIAALLAAKNDSMLQAALGTLLLEDDIGTQSERLLRAADDHLLGNDLSTTVVFDGLDTGFESGSPEQWLSRQERFVTALLQVMMDARTRFRRLSLKVFLREDIFLRLSIQNGSHLEPAKLELRWQPEDLWRIVLNLACTSPTYLKLVQALRPGIDRPWSVDEGTLRKLLNPLWGETVGKGKAKTSNYIQKRTADAQGRLFPRTLVQLLDAAIQKERTQEPVPSATRVIRFASLSDGVTKASEKRVGDLKKEYVELAPYLDALSGMDGTGVKQKFISHMTKQLSDKGKGATRLHLGAGGWDKVLNRLEEVGVLGPYSLDKSKLAVALLYRKGLRIKGAGMM
ncbi:MAG: AAA family ATPase [Myxococcales bacterium]|nr:AAA family ATPase [Myxococcales bacterium]